MSISKAVIVTGCASGNGFEISKKLAKDGFLVYGIDTKKSKHSNFLENFIEGDIANEDNQKYIFENVCKKHNNVSLVNNAGITKPSSEVPYPIKDWDLTIKINLTAPHQLMNLYLSNVINGDIQSGSIVNITSLASHKAFPDNPSYIASKHGLLGINKYYALKLGQYNIRVNSVSPGYIQTEMTSKSFNDKKRREIIAQKSFLNRWGTPGEVSDAVSFLLSENAAFISGSEIVVDGGWLSLGLR